MSKPKLLDELPGDARVGVFHGEFWATLAANPGKWAEWPGSPKSSIASLAGAHSRNGVVYEGVRRGGKSYVRCVPK